MLQIPEQDLSCKLFKLILPMKRVKESGAFFRKKKKAREEELKKNEGAIFKFVKNASAKETEEVSSHSKSLTQVETEEEEVYLEQNNNEVIIERSQPMKHFQIKIKQMISIILITMWLFGQKY